MFLAVWLFGGLLSLTHAAPLAGTVITNQASMSYSDLLSGAPVTVLSNTVQATVQQAPAFTLTASQTKNAVLGTTVYFQHVLTNTGNGTDSFNLAISDFFAGGFNLSNLILYPDANGDGVPDSVTPVSSTGPLVAGAAFRFIAAANVSAVAPPGAQDQLTVTANGTATATPAPAQSNTDTVVIANSLAALTLNKTFSVASGPSPASSVLVTITYANTGSGAAANVAINDVVGGVVLSPAYNGSGFSYVPGSAVWSGSGASPLTDVAGNDPAGISYQAITTGGVTSINAVLASLPAGATGTLSFQVDVKPGQAAGSATTQNAATVSFFDGAATQNGASPVAAYNVVVTPAGADLVLQKSHTRDFTVNNNNFYTLTVSNRGNQPTNNVVTVTDTLPPGLVFVPTLSGGASWTCSGAGQLVTCNSPTIISAQAGATPGVHPNPLSIVVRPNGAVLTALPTTLTNNAVVSGGGEPAANTGNNAASDATVIQLPASLNGRVWRDVNHDRIFNAASESAFVLAGWRVEVCARTDTVCDAGTRLGTALTGTDGTYAIKDLPAGDYKLQFRDPNNNVINGTPVNGDSGTPQSGSTLDPNKRFLFVTLKPGENLAQQSLPLDPSGVVYDSITRLPVAGATVTLIGPPGFDADRYLLGGKDNVNQVTGPTGLYQFVLLAGFPSGNYSLKVVPPAGYQAAPSALFPPLPGALTPPVGCTLPSPQVCSVDPNNLPTAPPKNVAPHYFMSFVLSAGNPDVVNNHIPIDPLGAGAASGLLVSKSSNKTVAEIGDFVDYAVKVQNGSAGALPAVVLRDSLPFGFSYVAGSARLNGVAVNPLGPGPTAVFDLGTLAVNTTATLSYRARLIPGAQLGDGINRAQAASGALQSNLASVQVKVQGGVFSDKAFVIGKVFVDCNLNGVQDAGDMGVPGVRLFLQDGTNITTDSEGKYSLYGLMPRTHVLKVDNTTLPLGAQLVVIANRQSGDAGSRFVDLKKGELHKADFALDCSPEILGAVSQRRAATSESSSETERVLKERLRPEGTPIPSSDLRGLPAAGVVGGTPGTPSGTQGGAAPVSRFESVTPGPLTSKNSNLPATPAPAAAALPLDQMIAGLDSALGFVGLKDGDTLPYAQTAVRVKGQLGGAFKLMVNGVDIGSTRIGTKLTLEDRQIQIWEYIGVALKPGANALVVTQLDSFGNARGSQTVSVIAPSDLGKIVIEAPKDVPADGRSLLKIKVKLTDDKGVPVTVRTALTLESSRARWQVEDINPAEPGIQVFIEGGTAEFTLLVPHEAGEDTLRVTSGILKTEHRIGFLPDLRPMIAAGVIEGAINFRSLNLRNVASPRQRDSFEQEIQRFSYSSSDGKTTAAARAALFLKGKVKGDYLLTLAYDSDKNLKDRLFRDIQPDEFYPIYGDSSVRGFDAQSTQRLYVRVDKGRSFVLYGDFLTSKPSEARKLADYSRSLTGVQQHYENDKVSINTFASQDTFRQLVEEFPANGTSGPFLLANRNSVINSEKIEILTRDRHQPAVVLKAEPQARFSDYEIEVFTGRILFKGPIASLDENLNPKSIRVIYEVDQGGEKFWIGGANAQVKLTDRVEVGASVVDDRNPQAPYRLSGLNTTLKFDDKTFLIGEIARSTSVAGTGEARRIELRRDDAKFNMRLSAGKADVEFENPSSQLSKGRTEVTGRAAYKVTPRTTLSAEALYTADALTQGRRAGVLLKAEHALEGGAKIEVGVRNTHETLASAQPGVTPQGAVPNEITTARVRVTAPVPHVPQANVYGEYEQSLSESDKKVAALGGDYLLPGRGKLYARHEFISSLSSPFALNQTQRNNVTVFGIDTDYAKDKHAFSEYRMRDAIDGRTSEAAIGLRNGWQVAEGLRLNTTAERVHALSGSHANESVAYTAGLDYTANPRLKASTRLEWRHGAQSNSLLGSIGVANKLDDEWTMLARGIHSVVETKGATPGERYQTRVQAGLAYRDLATDRWNSLGRVEYRNEDDSTQPGLRLKRALTLGSLHFNYQPDSSMLISGRFATKAVHEDSTGLTSSSKVSLLSGRMTVDFARDWDFGIHASMLGSRNFSDRQFGLGVEVGYQLASNTWLSAGYNIFGFREKDLTSDPTDRGAYIRLRYKFDEDVFKSKKDKPAPVYSETLRPKDEQSASAGR
jgi:uncharacterized repeat protein (TIGR01451 family)